MTIEAVAVLQTIARDEFERDWNGFDEPFQFIDGAFDEPPVREITVELDGKTYVFPSKALVDVIQDSLETIRYEAEDEEDDDEGPGLWNFKSDEQVEEEAWDKLIKYWSGQLDTEEETLAAVETRMEYVVKSWQELVAHFNMVGERMPDLKPVLAEKLQAAYDEVMEHLQ